MNIRVTPFKTELVIRTVTACLTVFISASFASANDVPAPITEHGFKKQAVPMFEMYCADCHQGDAAEGGFDLDRYAEGSQIQTEFEIWEKVLRVVTERQMPPKDADQPSEVELQELRAILQAELATFDCEANARPGRVTLRRLNRAEYNNTVRDLLGVDYRPADEFPSDDVGNGFDNIGDVLVIPPLLMEKYLAAAEQIVERTFANEELKKKILVHKAEGEGVELLEAVRKNIDGFASRAFRRPATDEELTRLLALMVNAYQQGAEPDEAFKLGMQAVLASPHFIFRVELDPTEEDADGIRELNGYEIASRLSYFLWSSMPDEELFALAKSGELTQATTIQAQVRRMLADPKSKALTENFAGQWLQLRNLSQISPNPEQFPSFNAELRDAMRMETELFFESILHENRSILDFLTADFSHVNETLAKHYGLEGIEGNEFRRVSLNADRRGVLTQASILLITSNPTRTSPVKRGKWILDNILGEPPPPPPEGVEELVEAEQALGSLRERMEEHRENESCAVCHRKMDTLGFGLENFDVIGSWRNADGKFAIDASGTLPGALSFKTPVELMELLAERKSQEFSRCLTEKMLTYALGRGLESYDRCAVNVILAELQEKGYRFRGLIEAIAISEPFLKREGKGKP